MKTYLTIMRKILYKGLLKENRTDVRTYALSGVMFEHDMSEGFPLLTTKKMSIKNIATELEGFIGGITDKQWYKDRNCNIWNEWSNPFTMDPNIKNFNEAQLKNNDLGPIYGYQWRRYNMPYSNINSTPFKPLDYQYDQLNTIVKLIRKRSNSRRLIVSAWNPLQMDTMALPPCHYSFQVIVNGEKLDLIWQQRSNDFFLGNPYNIASYALLLTLLAKEGNLKPGKLIGQLGDVHLYENHINQTKLQLSREPFKLPTVEIENFTTIFNWKATDVILNDYKCHAKIKAKIAV